MLCGMRGYPDRWCRLDSVMTPCEDSYDALIGLYESGSLSFSLDGVVREMVVQFDEKGTLE